jgi:hypothetical protein
MYLLINILTTWVSFPSKALNKYLLKRLVILAAYHNIALEIGAQFNTRGY